MSRIVIVVVIVALTVRMGDYLFEDVWWDAMRIGGIVFFLFAGMSGLAAAYRLRGKSDAGQPWRNHVSPLGTLLIATAIFGVAYDWATHLLGFLPDNSKGLVFSAVLAVVGFLIEGRARSIRARER